MAALALPPSFAFSLAGGSATSGADFTTPPTFSNGVTLSGGSISVPAGVSTFTITVAAKTDAVFENNETYTLSVGGKDGTGTITNAGSSAPTITAVSTGSAAEGDAVVHTVTVSGTSATSTSFASSLAGGSATVGTDLPANLATATFSNGVTYSAGNLIVPGTVTTFTVAIPTTEEVAVEADETYTLTVGGQSGIGTITNDDAAPAPTITAVSTGSAAEGDAVVHTVTVSGTSATSTSFASSLAGGSATVGTDLPANLATATFSNGVTYSAGNLIVPGHRDHLHRGHPDHRGGRRRSR